MGLREWVQKIKNRIKKQDTLPEPAKRQETTYPNREFVPRVEDFKLSREDILRKISADIQAKDLTEIYQYDKFSEEEIRKKYDSKTILSAEDITAIGCLRGAILQGNEEEFPNFEHNRINSFLQRDPNNIITLVDLMIQDGKREFKQIEENDPEAIKILSITPRGLIPGTYTEISTIIDYYEQQKVVEGERDESL